MSPNWIAFLLLLIQAAIGPIIGVGCIYLGVKYVRRSATRITGIAYLAVGAVPILAIILALSGFYKA